MKKQTTTRAIGSDILSMIRVVCNRGDGVMIRHNGQDIAIVACRHGWMISDDGIEYDPCDSRIYRATIPQLRSLATMSARTVVVYSDATLVIDATNGLFTWRTVVNYRTVAMGYSTHHDNALNAAYAIAIT